MPLQWKISEKSVALFFGFQINSFCAASCLLKILQLWREIQEQEKARESKRERGRETCLLAGNSPILGKEMAEERERETCLLAEISPTLWKEMKRERDLLACWIFSNYGERDGGRHSKRGPEGKRELLAILQFWREILETERFVSRCLYQQQKF